MHRSLQARARGNGVGRACCVEHAAPLAMPYRAETRMGGRDKPCTRYCATARSGMHSTPQHWRRPLCSTENPRVTRCSRGAASPVLAYTGSPSNKSCSTRRAPPAGVTDQIRRGKGPTVQRGREAPPEALRRNLRPMGQQGLALDLTVWPDIEGHRRGLRPSATGPSAPAGARPR